MSHRVEKFASTLKHCLAEVILTEINNPRLQGLSISQVIVPGDLKKAHIYVYSPLENPEVVLQALTKAKGFIKRALAKKMFLKYMPELIFLSSETNGRTNEKENSRSDREITENRY